MSTSFYEFLERLKFSSNSARIQMIKSYKKNCIRPMVSAEMIGRLSDELTTLLGIIPWVFNKFQVKLL